MNTLNAKATIRQTIIRNVERTRAQQRRFNQSLRNAVRGYLKKDKALGVAIGSAMTMVALFAASPASAQYVVAGGTAPVNITNEGILDRIGGAANLTLPDGTAGQTAQGVAVGASTAYGGGVTVGTGNIAGLNNTSMGVALGNVNYATGAYSTGIGYANSATATSSVAIGTINTASGNTSIAMGRQTTASGNFSIAMGNTTQATGLNAIALGNSTKASGINAIAIGGGQNGAAGNLTDATAANASGANSVALGVSAAAAASNSFVGGYKASVAAGASESVAIGSSATVASSFGYVAGTGSVAIGNTSSSTNDQQGIAIGSGANVTGKIISAGVIESGNIAIGGNASATSTGVDTVNASSQVAIGLNAKTTIDGAISIGEGSTATGFYATTTGSYAAATGAGAVATGGGAQATAVGAIAIGGATGLSASALTGFAAASGVSSIAMGTSSVASAADAIAIGTQSAASAAGAVAIGLQATAKGGKAVSIGVGNTADGDGAVAIGDPNKATGAGAVALGKDNTATGVGAVALGNTNTSIGQGSVAMGSTSAANNAGSVALGDTANVSVAATKGVALGSGATVTAAGGVALGQGSLASRAAITAIADPISTSGATVTTTTGAVAVGGRQIINVAAGTQATDAVNVGQITPIVSNLGNLGKTTAAALGGTAAYDPATGKISSPAYTISGTTYNDVGSALGALAAASGSTKYFHANSTLADSSATGTDSVAVGPLAVASGTNALAEGKGATASGGSATALGVGATASATNSTAVGDGATAAGINAVALGALANAGINGNGIAIGGSANASGGSATALGGNSKATNTFSMALGDSAQSTAVNAIAVGRSAVASNADSVALGANSTTSAVNAGAYTINGGTAAGTAPASVVSVGSAGNERQITNVAAGVVSATSTDAVNGSQLFAVGTAVNAVGTTTAANFGGGATFDPLTGKVSSPSYTVGSGTYNNVGSALTALQTGAPVQYSTAGAPTTANGLVPSNNMTLVGKTAGGVVLDNVAPGSTLAGSTQAINGGQLNTGLASVATNFGGGSVYDPVTGKVTAPSITVAGKSYSDVTSAIQAAGGGFNLTTAKTGTGVANGTSVANVAPGSTATVTAGNNIITTQSGSTIEVAVNPVLTGLTSVGITGGPTIDAAGIKLAAGDILDMGGNKITNLAAGSTATGSTEAINGGQLNTGLASVATNFGGGSTYDPVTGKVTAPSYTVAGSAYNNVGSALGAVDTSLTNLTNGTAGLVQQTGGAPGSGQITVGAATGGTSLSVAGTAGDRTVTGVAAGTIAAASTDAINGSQIAANQASVASALGGGAKVNPDGTLAAPSYTVGSNNLGDVGSAIAALQTGAPVQYSTAGAPTTANGLVPSNNMTLVGAKAGGVVLDNLAPGSTAAGSTQAINGSQLNTGLASVATNFGGGSAYDPVTGKVTAPSYTIGSTTYNDAGSAFSAINLAVAGGAGIKYFHANSGLADSAPVGTDAVAIGPVGTAVGDASIAVGKNASSVGVSSIAMGDGASAATGGAIAIGKNASALGGKATAIGVGNVANGDGAVAIGDPNVATGIGAVALGKDNTATGTGAVALGNTNVANGQGAVALGSTSTANAAGAVALGDTAVANNKNDVALGSGSVTAAPNTGAYTINGGTVAGTAPASVVSVGSAGNERQITNVAAGVVSATSTDAINGSQLYVVGTAINTVGTTVAANFGGGATYDPLTGKVSAPNYTVGTGTYNDVGSALTALQTGAPVQYSTAGAPATPNGLVPSNNMTLVGAKAGGVVLDNVAPGSTVAGSTQAINGGQLNTGLASVATNLGGGSTYDPVTGKVTAPTYNIGATAYNDVGSALASLDNSVNGGAGIKYFHSNSALADSQAIGTDSVAIGPNAVANAAGSIALGAGSDASRGAITAVLDPLSLTGGTVTTTVGELSVGSAAAPRQITNVAAGTQVTDAVNVGQILPIIAAQNQLGTTAAANFGGGASYDPATGKISAPSYTVGGTVYTNTGSAIAALDKSVGSAIAVNNTSNLANPVASGTDTTAISPGAVASGADAIAAGKNSLASGAQATAMGPGAQATGAQSTAIGNGAIASATSATALGDNAKATGTDSTALGQNTLASGANSTATGYGAQATGDKSLASGNGAVAAGTSAVALGDGASATGNNSVALGAGSTDGGQANVVSVGAVGAERKIVNVAAGTVSATSTDAVNGSQLYGLSKSAADALGGGSTVNPDGTITAPVYSVGGSSVTGVGGAITALDTSLTALQNQVGGAIAVNNTSKLANPVASGTDATAISPGSVASGADALAAGKNSLASGDQAVALGNGAQATATSTTAVGDNAKATAADATALGQNTLASAANATATGFGAQATGTAATATGNNSVASGASSVAMGDGSKASGDLATAVGPGALASGKQSIALGSNAQATAFSTTAVGDGAVASAANSTALGQDTLASGLDSTATGYKAQSTGANSVALGANSTDGGQANVVSIGSVGAERKLVNVAAGTISATSTDAVNGSQLNATNQQVAALDHRSVQYATGVGGQTLSEINLSSDAGGPVVIHNLAAGVAATDAANVGQVDAVAAVANNSAQYDKTSGGGKADSITFQGGTPGAAVSLRNVAAGVNATDAVNLGQLQSTAASTLASANNYTDQKVSNLAAFAAQGIKEAKQLAISGTAIALAGTGLRYDDRPGKTSVSGATSFYKGEVGLAFGIGHTSQDQVWRTNLSVNSTPWAEKPEIGVVVGATFTFN